MPWVPTAGGRSPPAPVVHGLHHQSRPILLLASHRCSRCSICGSRYLTSARRGCRSSIRRPPCPVLLQIGACRVWLKWHLLPTVGICCVCRCMVRVVVLCRRNSGAHVCPRTVIAWNVFGLLMAFSYVNTVPYEGWDLFSVSVWSGPAARQTAWTAATEVLQDPSAGSWAWSGGQAANCESSLVYAVEMVFCCCIGSCDAYFCYFTSHFEYGYVWFFSKSCDKITSKFLSISAISWVIACSRGADRPKKLFIHYESTPRQFH